MRIKDIKSSLLSVKNACMPITISILFPTRKIEFSDKSDGYTLGQTYRFGVENEVVKTPCTDADFISFARAYAAKIYQHNAMIMFADCTVKKTGEKHFIGFLQTKTDWVWVDAYLGKTYHSKFDEGYFELANLLDHYKINAISVWSEQGSLAEKEAYYFNHLLENG